MSGHLSVVILDVFFSLFGVITGQGLCIAPSRRRSVRVPGSSEMLDVEREAPAALLHNNASQCSSSRRDCGAGDANGSPQSIQRLAAQSEKKTTTFQVILLSVIGASEKSALTLILVTGFTEQKSNKSFVYVRGGLHFWQSSTLTRPV